MPFIVCEVKKSNHTKMLAVFESKKLAEIYVKMKCEDQPWNRLKVVEMPFMDSCAEIIQYVMK
jgi:hypothetical protein